jgi:hypothetical protein
VPRILADMRAGLDAVDPRHDDVEQNSIDAWRLLRIDADLQEAERLPRRAGAHRAVAAGRQHGVGDIAPRVGIVNDEDAHHRPATRS